MEPKNPIIINGVNVSGCDELVNGCDCYLTQEHDYRSITPYTYNKCSRFPNCYFKQLARKERECQRAEQKLTLIRDFITDTQIYNMAHSICDKILQIIDEVK